MEFLKESIQKNGGQFYDALWEHRVDQWSIEGEQMAANEGWARGWRD